MKNIQIIRVLPVLAWLCCCTSSFSQQMEYFLSMDSIQGSSTSAAYKNQIAVSGFYYGATNYAVNAGSTVAGKSSFSSLTIQKEIDKSSPILAQSAAAGTAYQKAVLTVLRDGVVFYSVTLTGCYVSGLSTTGDASSTTELVSISYSAATWKFGATQAGYNFASQVKQ